MFDRSAEAAPQSAARQHVGDGTVLIAEDGEAFR